MTELKENKRYPGGQPSIDRKEVMRLFHEDKKTPKEISIITSVQIQYIKTLIFAESKMTDKNGKLLLKGDKIEFIVNGKTYLGAMVFGKENIVAYCDEAMISYAGNQQYIFKK